MNNILENYNLADIEYSDSSHLFHYTQYKTPLFWIPLRGWLLFVETLRTTTSVNFVNNNKFRNFFQKKLVLFSLPLLILAWCWCFAIIFLAIFYRNTWEISHYLLNVLLPYIIATGLWLSLSYFAQILIIKSYLRYFKKTLTGFSISSGRKIFYNAKITDFNNYAIKFLKAKKRLDYWYKASDNFEVFEGEQKIINYEGSKRQKWEKLRQQQENMPIVFKYFFFGLITLIFLDYKPLVLLNANLLYLKTILDMNGVKKYNKKIIFYVVFNWLFSLLCLIGLGLLAYFLFFDMNNSLSLNYEKDLSLIVSNVLFNFLYLFIYLLGVIFLFFLKNHLIKKSLIKQFQNTSF